MCNSNYGYILERFEISDFEKYYRVEIQVKGQSMSPKLVPFDSLPVVSY